MDEDRYFILNRGSLEFRLDPVFYKPSIIAFVDVIKKMGAKPVHAISTRVVDGPFGTQLKVDEYQPEGIPVIRVSNVRTGEILEDNLIYITPEKQYQLRRSKVLPNDVVLTKAGAILGYAAVFPEHLKEANITSHSAAITCGPEVLPHYLKLIFHSAIGQRQIYRWGNKSTRPELNTQEVKRILIPILPIIKQEKLIEKYHQIIAERKSKEAQAGKLLEGIDDYLLKELGISLPPEPANTIENRTFKTSFTKVSGNRFDPKKYSIRTEQLYGAVKNSKYPIVSLKNLLTHSVSGEWGSESHEFYNEKIYTSCLVLRSTEFDNRFNLELENSRSKYRLIGITKLKKLDLKPFDILLEKSGGSPDQPVGRVALLTADILSNRNICYSNFIHKFRLDSNVIVPEYAFAFLKVMHNIKLTDTMQSQTNGIRNLIMREYWNQGIPIPDKLKQEEIAERFKIMKAKAKELLLQANSEFEAAKKDIEKLILNDIT